MKKKCLFFVIVLFLFPFSCWGLVSPSEQVYVTDHANILKNDTREYIVQYSDFLKENNDIDYYVVTVKNLEGMDLDTYADQVYETFSIQENGLLILFAKKERTIKVVAGEEMSLILDGDIINQYIDSYFMPYFKNEEWNKGILNGYSAFYKRICQYYDIDSSPMEVYDGNDFLVKYKYPILVLIIWICTTLSYVFCKFFKRIYKNKTHSLFDISVFGVSLFTNIMLMIFAYSLEPLSLLILFGTEILTVIGMFGRGNDISLEEAVLLAEKAEQKKKKSISRKRNPKRKKT